MHQWTEKVTYFCGPFRGLGGLQEQSPCGYVSEGDLLWAFRDGKTFVDVSDPGTLQVGGTDRQ